MKLGQANEKNLEVLRKRINAREKKAKRKALEEAKTEGGSAASKLKQIERHKKKLLKDAREKFDTLAKEKEGKKQPPTHSARKIKEAIRIKVAQNQEQKKDVVNERILDKMREHIEKKKDQLRNPNLAPLLKKQAQEIEKVAREPRSPEKIKKMLKEHSAQLKSVEQKIKKETKAKEEQRAKEPALAKTNAQEHSREKELAISKTRQQTRSMARELIN